jgi:Spy/CpxP family protein refolding chaperone
MTTKRWSILAAVIAALILAAVPFVYAQGFHRGHRGHGAGEMAMFGRLERAQEALDLSDAQVDQIKAIGKALREQNQPYRDQLRGGFTSIAQTLLKNPNDIAAAQAILDQQANAERAVRQNMLTAASKALNVLTPEQRQKAADFLSERASRMQR